MKRFINTLGRFLGEDAYLEYFDSKEDMLEFLKNNPATSERIKKELDDNILTIMDAAVRTLTDSVMQEHLKKVKISKIEKMFDMIIEGETEYKEILERLDPEDKAQYLLKYLDQ